MYAAERPRQITLRVCLCLFVCVTQQGKLLRLSPALERTGVYAGTFGERTGVYAGMLEASLSGRFSNAGA